MAKTMAGQINQELLGKCFSTHPPNVAGRSALRAGGSATAAPPSYSMATMSSTVECSLLARLGLLLLPLEFSEQVGSVMCPLCRSLLSPILDDLGIPYKIIEGRERVGGRLYTYTFRNNLKDWRVVRLLSLPLRNRYELVQITGRVSCTMGGDIVCTTS